MSVIPTIFVSYAHVDNQPYQSGMEGWISCFVQHLRTETNRRMGRADDYSVWMDFRLKSSDAITPEIEQQLNQAHVLVILMSRGWLRSEWCPWELEHFCKQHPDAVQEGRIFVIDQDGLPHEEKPPSLHDLLPVPFYTRTVQERIRQLAYPFPQSNNPDHQPYFDRVVDLSYQLQDALLKFSSGEKVRAKFGTVQPTVYVAPVNDSLYDQRATLISELDQFGIRVLPAANRYDRDMESSLGKCSHFVQLLDADYAQGMPFEQHFMAEKIGIRVLQWRDSTLDTKKITNPEQKVLLEGETVRACELSDFIRQVREAVQPPQNERDYAGSEPETKPVNGGKTVFVHASPDDFDRAHQVARNLRSRGWGIVLPRYTGDAANIRKSIERGYKNCHVLLILQHRASADVVEDYLSDAQVHAQNAPVLICQGEGADELFFIPHGVQTLACNSHFEDDCLEQFLAEVEA